jgi:hypothetical protein
LDANTYVVGETDDVPVIKYTITPESMKSMNIIFNKIQTFFCEYKINIS